MTLARVSTPLIVAAVAQTQVSAGVTADYFIATPTAVAAAAAAYLDYRGLNKKVRESITATESALFTIAKVFADTYGVSDPSSFFVSKQLTDSVGTPDVITSVTLFVRYFDELITASESTTVSFSKPLYNFVGLSQVVSKTSTKILADAVGLNDSAALGDGGTYTFDKSVNNVAFAGDSSAITFQPAFADLYGVSEASYRALVKELHEVAAVSDSLGWEASYLLADIATIQEQRGVEFARPLSSSAGMSDSSEASTLKFLSDTLTATASGVLVSQSYCDLTYFETDYVGEYRTF
jgi:hypothetical protein